MTVRKFTKEQIMSIPDFIEEGKTLEEIKNIFKMGNRTLSGILNKKYYKEFQDEFQKKLEKARSEKLKKINSNNKTCTKCNKIYPKTSEFFQFLKKRNVWESHCKNCKKIRTKNKYEEYKIKVYNFYGAGKVECNCCKEKNIVFLAVDHVNGNGNQHRKNEITGKNTSIYKWLVDNDYPQGFQILCMNCNWGKWIYGVCPHQQPI